MEVSALICILALLVSESLTLKTFNMSVIISSKSLFNVVTREKNNNGAVFTVKSLKTKKDFTYKISRKFWNKKWYTHVRCENGYLNFNYLGTYFNGKIFKKGAVNTIPTAESIAFILKWVEQGKFEWLDTHMEVMHEGKCLCCGKTLTDANSIQKGIGPVCAGSK